MASMACALALGSSRAAAADETADTALAFALSWDAPSTCPTRDEVDARVRALLAGSQRKETVQANVVVTHRRETWNAEIRTRVGDAQGRRTLSAASCDRLASATALVIALTIDPDLQVEPPPPVPDPPPKPPDPVTPPPPAHEDDATSPVTRNGPRIGLRVAAVGGVGSLPSATAGVALGLSLNLRPWRFEAYGEGWLSRSATASSLEGAGGDFSLLDVGVRGCITSNGQVFVGACAGIEVDRVHAQGYGITREDTASRVWLAPRAGSRLGVKITENLELPLEIDLLVPLTRPSFALESASALDGPASRVAEFQGRSSVETWLFGILMNVVQHFRRTRARHLNRVDALTAMGDSDVQSSNGPHDSAAHREQVKILHALLDELDDEKRAVFILAELEEKSVPEISEALGVNVNTVYSRLRAARQELERAIQRLNAREKGGGR